MYTAEPTDSDKQDEILRLLENTLTEDGKDICEGQLTLPECTKAVKSFARKKSPGTDGFPAEFYQHFWDILGSDFAEMANACYDSSSLAPSQRVALISTIFKKGDDGRFPFDEKFRIEFPEFPLVKWNGYEPDR